MEPMTVLVDSPFVIGGANGTEIKYNILPCGHFYDKRYGIVNITRNKVDKMAANFGKQPAYDVPVKLGHSVDAACLGKVKHVTASDAGLEITMDVDADTAAAIKDKRYRYMSAEFAEDYVDKATGKSVGPVLLGAALVNQPGHPDVAPLVLADADFGDEKKGSNEMDEARLKELEAKVAALEAKNNELEAEKTESAKKFSDLEAVNETLMAEKRTAEVNAFCEKWTAKGLTPRLVNIAKPVLLADSKVVKLSDGTGNDKPLMVFLGELFEAIPKVEMGQKSESGNGVKELSDIEQQLAHAKRIADIANSKGGN